MSINFTEEQRETAATVGVSAAVVVTIGSILANAYVSITRATAGFPTLGDWGIEGWLNVILNTGLTIGSEILGFVALGFVIYFGFRGSYLRATAALAVFIVSLIINVPNTHAFVIGQAQASAERQVKASETYLEHKATIDAEPLKMTGLEPAAIQMQIAGWVGDRNAARADGRWAEVRAYGDKIDQGRIDLAAAITLAKAVADDQAARTIAAAEMDRMAKGATPGKGAEDLATRTMWALHIISALGLFAFTLGDMRILESFGGGKPIEAPKTEKPATGGYPPVVVSNNDKPKQTGTRAKGKTKGPRTDEQRERQRAYTAKWRSGLKKTG